MENKPVLLFSEKLLLTEGIYCGDCPWLYGRCVHMLFDSALVCESELGFDVVEGEDRYLRSEACVSAEILQEKFMKFLAQEDEND